MLDIIREREAWTRWQKTIHFVNNRGPWEDKEKQEPLGWQGAKHFVAGVLEADKKGRNISNVTFCSLSPHYN